MPLLLISMTSSIIINNERITKVVLINFLLFLLFYIIEILTFVYYVVPTIESLIKDFTGFELNAKELLEEVLGEFSSINIFIDLLLCSLIYLFFVYTPKHIKNRIIFRRLLTIIPVSYIVISFLLNGLAKTNLISINLYLGALLPHKNIITYVFFFITIIFVKYNKKIFYLFNKNKDKTYESYTLENTFLSNYNYFLIILLCLLSIIDFSFSYIPNIKNWGIGNNYYLFVAIPFLFFYNYQKSPKRKIWKQLIPLYSLTNYLLLFLLYCFCLF